MKVYYTDTAIQLQAACNLASRLAPAQGGLSIGPKGAAAPVLDGLSELLTRIIGSESYRGSVIVRETMNGAAGEAANLRGAVLLADPNDSKVLGSVRALGARIRNDILWDDPQMHERVSAPIAHRRAQREEEIVEFAATASSRPLRAGYPVESARDFAFSGGVDSLTRLAGTMLRRP